MTFLMLSVILLSILKILLSVLSVIRHLIWQQVELASEIESDLRDTVDWDRKWLVDFNAGKTQPFSFAWSNNSSAIGALFKSKVQLWHRISLVYFCS